MTDSNTIEVGNLAPEHVRALRHIAGVFSDAESQMRSEDSARALERRREKAAHEASLAEARKDHDAECLVRSRALDEREQKLAAREHDLQRRSDAVEALRSRFERKQRAIEEAMA